MPAQAASFACTGKQFRHNYASDRSVCYMLFRLAAEHFPCELKREVNEVKCPFLTFVRSA